MLQIFICIAIFRFFLETRKRNAIKMVMILYFFLQMSGAIIIIVNGCIWNLLWIDKKHEMLFGFGSHFLYVYMKQSFNVQLVDRSLCKKDPFLFLIKQGNNFRREIDLFYFLLKCWFEKIIIFKINFVFLSLQREKKKNDRRKVR